MNLATRPSADSAPCPGDPPDRQEGQEVCREGHPGGHDAGRQAEGDGGPVAQAGAPVLTMRRLTRAAMVLFGSNVMVEGSRS